MKKIALALVLIFAVAGVASATDCVRERIVVPRVVEKIVEVREVPHVRIVERVRDDYGYHNRVERIVVRKDVQRVQKVVKVEKVRNQGLVGRILGR